MNPKWIEIAELPTVIETSSGQKIHESCLRSYMVVKKMISCLQKGWSIDAVIEMAEDVMKHKQKNEIFDSMES